MAEMASGVILAVLGLTALAALRLVDGGAGPVAALVPPWQAGGLARAAALDMPLIDMRWAGHLLVVDPGPQGRDRLRAQGLWMLRADPAGLCVGEGGPATPRVLERTGT